MTTTSFASVPDPQSTPQPVQSLALETYCNTYFGRYIQNIEFASDGWSPLLSSYYQQLDQLLTDFNHRWNPILLSVLDPALRHSFDALQIPFECAHVHFDQVKSKFASLRLYHQLSAVQDTLSRSYQRQQYARAHPDATFSPERHLYTHQLRPYAVPQHVSDLFERIQTVCHEHEPFTQACEQLQQHLDHLETDAEHTSSMLCETHGSAGISQGGSWLHIACAHCMRSPQPPSFSHEPLVREGPILSEAQFDQLRLDWTFRPLLNFDQRLSKVSNLHNRFEQSQKYLEQQRLIDQQLHVLFTHLRNHLVDLIHPDDQVHLNEPTLHPICTSWIDQMPTEVAKIFRWKTKQKSLNSKQPLTQPPTQAVPLDQLPSIEAAFWLPYLGASRVGASPDPASSLRVHPAVFVLLQQLYSVYQEVQSTIVFSSKNVQDYTEQLHKAQQEQPQVQQHILEWIEQHRTTLHTLRIQGTSVLELSWHPFIAQQLLTHVPFELDELEQIRDRIQVFAQPKNGTHINHTQPQEPNHFASLSAQIQAHIISKQLPSGSVLGRKGKLL